MNKILRKQDESIFTTKAFQGILWILGVSWLFGFTAFAFFDKEDETFFGISVLILAILPAIIALVLNRRDGGSLKTLHYVKSDKKFVILAFITPIIYFFIIFSAQYLLGIRSEIDFDKFESINQLILSWVLGYPVMLLLIMGEEIAWRGYLEDKMVNTFGGDKGIFYLGLIWGIWHLPLSLQGHNFPNHPMLETFITTPLMCIALSYIIAYFGLSKRSIWIGIVLHASNNHFGGSFLYMTKTYDEINHAISFVVVYIIIIVIFRHLYNRRVNDRLLKVG